jgi:cell division protein FtsA
VSGNQVRTAAGLDAGSARIRVVACALEPDCTIRLIGCAEVPSRGWAKGRIADQTALCESVLAAAEEVERQAGAVIEGVVAGMAGGTILGQDARWVYEFGRPREIEASDLAYAIKRASQVQLSEDRCVLQVLPQDFTVDGRAGYRNPKGIACSRLEANVYTITVAAQEHQGLINAVHNAHLAVAESVFEPMAGAYACLLAEDRARGVALVDIGAHSTDIGVYDGDVFVLASSVPIGGDHFTRDVAWCLRVSFEDAERLKEEYGCAMLGLTPDNVLIEVPSAEGRAPRETTRRQLNEILEARAEELFHYVRQELVRAGMEQSLMEGVALAGGGALLNGMCDMCERVLNVQTQFGLPVGILGWPEDLNSPAWTTAAGLAMYSARLKLEREFKRKVPGVLGMVWK